MLKAVTGLVGLLMGAQAAVAQSAYPIVFEDSRTLASLGVTLQTHIGEPVPAFSNKCHYYGDGGGLISLSDEFVAPYLARGFSVPSICLAVISAIRFDPETGHPLATFVLADVDSIEKYGFDPFSMSGEYGLELPACFANGRPLSDCNFQHDPKTGKLLNAQTRKNIEGLAAATDNVSRDAIASGMFDRECADGGPVFPDCRTDFYPDEPDYEIIKGYRGREEPRGLNWPVAFIDVSDEFPAGYGYPIFADGAAGPSADLDAAKIAVDPKRRASKAIMESLIVKLKQ